MTIAAETEKLIDDARANRLAPDDELWNIYYFKHRNVWNRIIYTDNKPAGACNTWYGCITDKPVVVNGEVKIRPIMNLSLTADHRVIDGAEAAKFIKRIKDIAENPYLLML